MSQGHTVVHIAGEVVGQNLFEGQEVLLGYLFLPDTGREPLRKMCRTFQTSAHAFSCRWPSVVPSLFGLFQVAEAGPGPGLPGTSTDKMMHHVCPGGCCC